MFGKITRDTFIAGTPVFKGEIYDLDEQTFQQLKRCKKIEPSAAPEDEAPSEPAKPKVVKVSGGKKTETDPAKA